MEISVTYVTIVFAHTIRLIKIEYKQRIHTHIYYTAVAKSSYYDLAGI